MIKMLLIYSMTVMWYLPRHVTKKLRKMLEVLQILLQIQLQTDMAIHI
jgi:hypothetical protein